MHQVAIASPQKDLVTPALRAAQKKAQKFWKKARQFGPVAIGPEVTELLRREHASVPKVFHATATMAFSKETSYRRPDGKGGFRSVIVNRPGGRRWSQRDLAAVAGVSVNTAVRALKRLRELGLIAWKAWRETGTYVFVKNFAKYVNPRSWRAALHRPREALENRVSLAGTLRSPPDQFLCFSDSDLPSDHQKEGDTLERPSVRRAVAALLERIDRIKLPHER